MHRWQAASQALPEKLLTNCTDARQSHPIGQPCLRPRFYQGPNLRHAHTWPVVSSTTLSCSHRNWSCPRCRTSGTRSRRPRPRWSSQSLWWQWQWWWFPLLMWKTRSKLSNWLWKWKNICDRKVTCNLSGMQDQNIYCLFILFLQHALYICDSTFCALRIGNQLSITWPLIRCWVASSTW